MQVNAILLKPLDGFPVGAPRSFDKIDFDRLQTLQAVREAGEDDKKPSADDENARMLERLRHPSDGPKLLADMRASFESLGRERERLLSELNAATASAEEAVRERNAAIQERDEAKGVAESLTAGRDALQAEIDQLRSEASKPDKPATKKTGAQA
jgi:hypothetical protein